MSQPFTPSPLPDDFIVYRSAGKKSWIDPDNDTLQPEAFYLREGEVGLSVSYNCSIDEATKALGTCYAVGQITVGDIRRITGLDVVADSETHAEIVGQVNRTDDPDKAKNLADLLAEISPIVWKK